jgi:hypothetical protein
MIRFSIYVKPSFKSGVFVFRVMVSPAKPLAFKDNPLNDALKREKKQEDFVT